MKENFWRKKQFDRFQKTTTKMKKKLYLGLVIFLITMPTIRAMDCTRDGFMCQTGYNCCSLLCNGYGFCHKGYPGTNLDPKDILAANPHLRPGYPPIQLNPAIFGFSPSGASGPGNPGMQNTYPNIPWGFRDSNYQNAPGGFPGNNNQNAPWSYPSNYPNPPWFSPPTVNPPPNPNIRPNVYNDRPDSTPLRLPNF